MCRAEVAGEEAAGGVVAVGPGVSTGKAARARGDDQAARDELVEVSVEGVVEVGVLIRVKAFVTFVEANLAEATGVMQGAALHRRMDGTRGSVLRE